MNIVVNRQMLLEALKFGGMVAGKCKTIPILDYCKVSIKGNKMVVTSTDTEITIAKRVNIITSDVEQGDFCIVPSDLINVLSTIRQEEVYLEVDDKNCVLQHGRGKATVAVLPAIDFPNPSTREDKMSFKMDAQKLSAWLRASSKFVAQDALRPALTGMYLAVEDGEVWCCASDSHKLHMDAYKDETLYGINTSVIVPSKAFSYASSIVERYDEATVQIDNNNVSFVVADAKISARQIVGVYPKVRQLLPKSTPIVVELNTEDFKDSVARMKLFADKVTGMVELSFTTDLVKMHSCDLLTNKSCDDSCEVSMYNGEPIEVCTKTESLEAILSNINSETLAIGLTTPKSPIVIYEADNKNKVLFTMPLLKAK